MTEKDPLILKRGGYSQLKSCQVAQYKLTEGSLHRQIFVRYDR